MSSYKLTQTAAQIQEILNQILVASDGYTDIRNERKLTAVDVSGMNDDWTGSVSFTLDGGITFVMTQSVNSDGDYVLTDDEGHETVLKGLS